MEMMEVIEIKFEVKMVFQCVEGIVVGEQVFDFEFKNVDGKIYSFVGIKDVNGFVLKGYVVIFICNICFFVVVSEQCIIDLYNKYVLQGYLVVVIQFNDFVIQLGDSFEVMQEWVEEMDYFFVYFFDEGQEVYFVYGVIKMFEVFLLDVDCYVKYYGVIDDSVCDFEGVEEKYLENVINVLMKNEMFYLFVIKVVGCGIKV